MFTKTGAVARTFNSGCDSSLAPAIFVHHPLNGIYAIAQGFASSLSKRKFSGGISEQIS